MKKPITILFVFAMILGFSMQAHAALVDNGNGTITQTRSDGSVLMWLQDANSIGSVQWLGASGRINDAVYKGYNWSGSTSGWPAKYYVDFNEGLQNEKSVTGYAYLLAVRSVSEPVVPEPVSTILFVTGGTLLACRRFFFPKEDD